MNARKIIMLFACTAMVAAMAACSGKPDKSHQEIKPFDGNAGVVTPNEFDNHEVIYVVPHLILGEDTGLVSFDIYEPEIKEKDGKNIYDLKESKERKQYRVTENSEVIFGDIWNSDGDVKDNKSADEKWFLKNCVKKYNDKELLFKLKVMNDFVISAELVWDYYFD